jgi:hypothetical protein
MLPGVLKGTRNAASAVGEDLELRMALEDISRRENSRGEDFNQ